MTPKVMIMIGMIVFSTIGGYVPVLFGADLFSMWAIIGNGLGGMVGVFVGFKISQYLS